MAYGINMTITKNVRFVKNTDRFTVLIECKIYYTNVWYIHGDVILLKGIYIVLTSSGLNWWYVIIFWIVVGTIQKLRNGMNCNKWYWCVNHVQIMIGEDTIDMSIGLFAHCTRFIWNVI